VLLIQLTALIAEKIKMPRKQSCLKSDNKSRSKMIDVRKHFVSFDDLEVLEFETILGDNPAVRWVVGMHLLHNLNSFCCSKNSQILLSMY
jgi:hypothetical protein